MEHRITPDTVQAVGAVRLESDGEVLRFTTTRRIPSEFAWEHLHVRDLVELPGPYCLPFTVSFSVCIDEPGFYVLVGNGHVNIGTPWNDNHRLDDIVEPRRNTFFFHNHIPMSQFADISITYGIQAMQVLVDGEERYYSTKERYMKAEKLDQSDATGLVIGLACDKGVHAQVRSIRVTELEGTAAITRGIPALREAIKGNEAAPQGEKPTFEACIARLPEALHREVLEMDDFLRAMKPLKFRRQIEPHGNKITYVAAAEGLSYAIYPSNDVLAHSLNWYIVTNGKPETWARKGDRMEQTLRAIAQSNPVQVEKLFDSLWECIGCYGSGCLARTRYEHNGRVKISCHGRMRFAMNAGGFEDAKAFIVAVNGLPGCEQAG